MIIEILPSCIRDVMEIKNKTEHQAGRFIEGLLGGLRKHQIARTLYKGRVVTEEMHKGGTFIITDGVHTIWYKRKIGFIDILGYSKQ